MSEEIKKWRIICDMVGVGHIAKDTLEEFTGTRAELDRRINRLAKMGAINISVDTEDGTEAFMVKEDEK